MIDALLQAPSIAGRKRPRRRAPMHHTVIDPISARLYR